MSNLDKKRLYNAVCYFPLVAYVMYFLDMEKDDELKQNIERGMLLFAIYAIFSIILQVFFLSSLLYLWYIGVSVYLGIITYQSKQDSVPVIDDILKKIKNSK